MSRLRCRRRDRSTSFSLSLSPSVLVLLLLSLLSLLSRASGNGFLTIPPSKIGGNLQTPVTEDDASRSALASFGAIDRAHFDDDPKYTPWKRPGDFTWQLARDISPAAPQILHPCGCDAGGLERCAGVDVGRQHGVLIDGYTQVTPPDWERGGEAAVAWNGHANHGGGYSYSMCKTEDFHGCREDHLPENTEEATRQETNDYLRCVWNCFEDRALEFVDDSQRLYHKDQPCDRVLVDTGSEAKRGRKYSSWRATPIPDRHQVTDGGEGKCTWNSVLGFGSETAADAFAASFGDATVCDDGPDQRHPKDWHVADRVKVPDDLEEGRWILSWRWDAYTVDRLWTGCADVQVVKPGNGDALPEDDCGTLAPAAPEPEASAPPSTTPVPEDNGDKLTCPDDDHTGMVPYDDCTKFYHCVKGDVRGDTIECPDGTLFDADKQICNWSYEVDCDGSGGGGGSDDERTCPPGFTGLVPWNLCAEFYHCVDGVDGPGPLRQCPPGTLFDPAQGYCNYEDEVRDDEACLAPDDLTDVPSLAPSETPEACDSEVDYCEFTTTFEIDFGPNTEAVMRKALARNDFDRVAKNWMNRRAACEGDEVEYYGFYVDDPDGTDTDSDTDTDTGRRRRLSGSSGSASGKCRGKNCPSDAEVSFPDRRRRRRLDDGGQGDPCGDGASTLLEDLVAVGSDDFKDLEETRLGVRSDGKKYRKRDDENCSDGSTDCATEQKNTVRDVLEAIMGEENEYGTQTQHECLWEGVTCLGSKVTSIQFVDKGLTGTIPNKIGSLKDLESLILVGNDITGSIPTKIGRVRKLVELDLDFNELTGTVPTEMGKLNKLKTLSLRNNELEGKFPLEVSYLPRLENLFLDNNKFATDRTVFCPLVKETDLTCDGPTQAPVIALYTIAPYSDSTSSPTTSSAPSFNASSAPTSAPVSAIDATPTSAPTEASSDDEEDDDEGNFFEQLFDMLYLFVMDFIDAIMEIFTGDDGVDV